MTVNSRIVVLEASFASDSSYLRGCQPEYLITFLYAGVPRALSDSFRVLLNFVSCWIPMLAFTVIYCPHLFLSLAKYPILSKISVVSEYASSLASTGTNKTISGYTHRLDLGTCLAYAKYVSSIRSKTVFETSLDFLLKFRAGYRLITNLQDDSARTVANYIDSMLDSGQLPDSQRKKYIAVLRKLCGNRGILPTSHFITDGLNKLGERPVGGGGFADVWEGSYGSKKVAIKVPRLYLSTDPEKAKKRFCKEAILWSHLSHPNVLPLIGVATSPFKFCMVSPWMENGDVIHYLKLHPQVNQIQIRILRDIIDGLAYLHSMNIIHGDLKGANILIDENGQACLADFGLTTIIPDSIPGYSISIMSNQGTVRWMAPELLEPEQFGLTRSIPSKESDIHAFGMVVCEVITRTVPFREHMHTATVMRKIISGVRPERPRDAIKENLVGDLWPLAEECWTQDRDQRPSAHQVLERLNKIGDR